MTTDGWASALAREYEDESPLLVVMIVCFMIFSALILMNLLAAIYVDKLMQITDEDKRRKKEAEEVKKRELMEKLSSKGSGSCDDGNIPVVE